MPTWLLYLGFSLMLLLAGTFLFFFTLTRGALLMRGALAGSQDEASHVYPIYSNMRLIRLVDFQPVISAILLFQYHRLVSAIVSGLRGMNLKDQNVLITSCAFGNVIPVVVKNAVESGAHRVQILDIIKNELDHAESKLADYTGRVAFLEDNASSIKMADGAVAANVIFFLLHELPHPLKGKVLGEAVRVLAPGGKLFLAEFHRPEVWVLRALSWTYFKVFEPLGLALWDTHDPLRQLEELGNLSCERRIYFFGNFQIITATKRLPV